MISYRKIFYATGAIFFVLAAAMAIPALADWSSSRNTSSCFVIGGIFCCFIGGLLFFSNQTQESIFLNLRERILTVLISWISVPILASIPLIISPLEISKADCFFEITSALTTTGATVVPDLKNFSEGFLLWRSMLQLLGGVGFITSCLYVFANFLAPISFERNNFSKNSDLPHQLKIILTAYLIAALTGSIMLTGSGISSVDSLCYSLDAISSGGVLISDVNYATASKITIWVLSTLMFVSGISATFIKNLTYNGFSAFKDRQFICYISIIAVCAAFLAAYIASFSDASILESLGTAVLAITSSVTTTGVTVPLPESFAAFTDAFIYALNFCGGCSGSCTGGIKIFRIMMIFLLIKSYLIRLVKTNAIYIPTYAGRKLDEIDVTGLLSYFSCYMIFVILTSLILTVSDLEFGKAFNAVITSINNNGPFFGLRRATMAEISELSSFAKIILTISMVVGRIEFISFFVVFIKPFWKK
ncbi:MAG: hypothetical protein LBO02_01520 [Holosporaceae bacterium]|jgi:trk system potassium uptake protein TrkH|nr:hypothetical protein [Holosporaceae bacterium]